MHLLSFFFLLSFISFLPKALAESPNFELSPFANEPAGAWRWEEEGQCWYRIVDGRGVCVNDQTENGRRKENEKEKTDIRTMSLSELQDQLREVLIDLEIDVSGYDLSGLSKYRVRSLLRDMPELSVEEIRSRLSSATSSTSSRVLDILHREDGEYVRSDRMQEILDREPDSEDDELGSRAREILNRNGGGFFSSDNSPRMHEVFYKPLGLFTCQNIYDEQEGDIFGPVPCTSYPGVFTEK